MSLNYTIKPRVDFKSSNSHHDPMMHDAFGDLELSLRPILAPLDYDMSSLSYRGKYHTLTRYAQRGEMSFAESPTGQSGTNSTRYQQKELSHGVLPYPQHTLMDHKKPKFEGMPCTPRDRTQRRRAAAGDLAWQRRRADAAVLGPFVMIEPPL
ncbi:hypothetical protein LTR86_001187 [Recurvomyces mirabilis]|nr:hypothetical protein LTR86_001187 [Recurvomyces mirabilis]